MKTEIIVIPIDEFVNIVKSTVTKVLSEHERVKTLNDNPKLYSINQVAKRLGMSHQRVKRLVKDGIIKSTADGRIREIDIEEYLKGN